MQRLGQKRNTITGNLALDKMNKSVKQVEATRKSVELSEKACPTISQKDTKTVPEPAELQTPL